MVVQLLHEKGVPKELTDELFSHHNFRNLRTATNTANNTHILKAHGIPSAECFSYIAKGQQFVGPSQVKVRNTVSIQMTPFFLASLFSEIPSTQDTDHNFETMLKHFMNSELPSTNSRIRQIHLNCQDNAKTYFQMKKETLGRSVNEYSKTTDAFPCATWTETEIKRIQKRLISNEPFNATNSDDMTTSFNCYHCEPMTNDDKNDSHLDLDDEFSRANITRLQIIRSMEQLDKHWSKLHSKAKKNHKFLVACTKCLEKQNYAIAFACCLGNLHIQRNFH